MSKPAIARPVKKVTPASEVAAREAKRAEILKAAAEACRGAGGYAWIDSNRQYVVVDTTKYSITPRG